MGKQNSKKSIITAPHASVLKQTINKHEKRIGSSQIFPRSERLLDRRANEICPAEIIEIIDQLSVSAEKKFPEIPSRLLRPFWNDCANKSRPKRTPSSISPKTLPIINRQTSDASLIAESKLTLEKIGKSISYVFLAHWATSWAF